MSYNRIYVKQPLIVSYRGVSVLIEPEWGGRHWEMVHFDSKDDGPDMHFVEQLNRGSTFAEWMEQVRDRVDYYLDDDGGKPDLEVSDGL